MKKMKKRMLSMVLLGLFLSIVISGCITTDENKPSEDGKDTTSQKFKILHIMSYHSPWQWTDDLFEGFKDGLDYSKVEYYTFQMDTKRNSTEEWKEQIGQEARDFIESWKPDLVYTTDDNAQEYVTKYYINSSIPFVFSGVNSDPATYGFTGSTNIAGVIEQEHFIETVNLLREISPDVKNISVIIDEGATWPAVVARMKSKQDQIPDVNFSNWFTVSSFEDYKQIINETQTDAFAVLGIFTFKDDFGENVPYQDILEWTANNSNKLDFSYWFDRISYGTLCAVTVSGYEQGLAAGKIARGILVDGANPSDYLFEPTVKGEPVISLARANRLGLTIKSSTLLSATIVEKFAWEE